MSKTPTRSPTHEDIDPSRLATMAADLEEIADNDEGELAALVELAEDRGRPASHYLATLPLATDHKLAGAAPLAVKECAGDCQRSGARGKGPMGPMVAGNVRCLDDVDVFKQPRNEYDGKSH